MQLTVGSAIRAIACGLCVLALLLSSRWKSFMLTVDSWACSSCVLLLLSVLNHLVCSPWLPAGQGTFGKVKLAKHSDTGMEYAIKILDKGDIKANELTVNVRREIAIMKALNHKNIVNLREVLSSKSKLYIVMDLVRGGELFDMIERKGELDETLARKYFQQLIDGIDYCHRRGVCHRDLKPENLLVDENGVLKITDFGVSSMKGGVGSDLLYTACGTPYYCAPEIINGAEEGYSGVKIDAWSCGIILYLLLTGVLPFQHDDMTRLYELINTCKVPYPSWMGSDAKDLICHLLVKDPEKRFSLEDVKKHSWFLVDYDTGDTPADSGRSFGSGSDRSKSRSRKNSACSAGGGSGTGRSRDRIPSSGSGYGNRSRESVAAGGGSRSGLNASSGGGSSSGGGGGGGSGGAKDLASQYDGQDLEVFIKDALPGKPQKKIDDVVSRLQDIDIDCVDDMQVVAEMMGTADKLTKWLEENPKIPAITAMRISKMFYG